MTWLNSIGWALAGFFLVRYLIMRRQFKAAEHHISLIRLFVSTGVRP